MIWSRIGADVQIARESLPLTLPSLPTVDYRYGTATLVLWALEVDRVVLQAIEIMTAAASMQLLRISMVTRSSSSSARVARNMLRKGMLRRNQVKS